jgi:DNA-binding Lrp family transcriptional regulator
MNNNKNRVRYTSEDVTKNRFYQMPKFLFEGDFKKGLSCEARCLYSLLKDRHELSLINNWVNESNEVFLIYTRDNMADMLGCSQPTLRKTIDQLTKFGLIEEEHMGLNRPNRIYLTSVKVENSGSVDPTLLECKNLSVRSEKIFQSGVKKSFSPECKNLSSNDTEYNKTNKSNTNQSIKEVENIKKESIKNKNDRSIDQNTNLYLFYTEEVKNNIDYNNLIEKLDKRFVDNVVDIMLNNICSENEYIKDINKPQAMIKDRLLQIKAEHIEKVYNNLKAKGREIQSPMSYYLSCLLNSVNQPTKINEQQQIEKKERKASYDIDEYENFSIFD